MRKIYLFLFCFWANGLLAQLQSPEAFLAYPLGEDFTPHHQILNYFEHLATDSRLKIIPYGSTYEKRPLVLAILSSPENMAKIEEIRLNNLRRTGLETGKANADMPAVIWLSYSVHGNESASSESVMQTAYELLTQEFGQNWLKKLVIILDPCVNPDGRERYVSWYKQMKGKNYNTSLHAREHRENNPSGRFNHYLFDMNRDWAWQSQQETQARLAVYQQWMPQIHVDFHEMGHERTYFFAPSAQPYHQEITDFQRDFQKVIGKNHAKYFDQQNWLYYTKETYDLLYPSYGDTWPIFNGAIGMTYEQGGSGFAGLGLLTPTGDTLSLKDRVAHHHRAGLSTIEVSFDNLDKILDAYNKFFEKNKQNPTGEFQAFIVKNNNTDKILELTQYLDRQNIRYAHPATSTNTSAFNYQNGKTENVRIESKDIIININQPKSTLIKVLFNPKTVLNDSLTYDATAWALPYSMALEAYASNKKIAVSEQKVSFEKEFVPTNEKNYAYVCEWKSWKNVRFLAQVLKAGIHVKFSEKGFQIAQKNFAEGTLLILSADNKHRKDFDEQVQKIAQSLDQKLWTSPTGFVENGTDFGSEKVFLIQKPKILLLSHEYMSPTSFGAYWHFLDQQLDYPHSVSDLKHFSAIPLHEYNTIILTENYRNSLDFKYIEKIQTWVREGGKLILVGNANEMFGLKSIEKTEDNSSLMPYADRERQELSNNVEGAIFKVFLDHTHPLAYGMNPTYFSLRRGKTVYESLKSGWNVGLLTENAHIDGFVGYKIKQKIQSAENIISSKSKEKLKGVLVFGCENLGRGQIVYLADDPVFRASWWAGRQILANAIFMVGQSKE